MISSSSAVHNTGRPLIVNLSYESPNFFARCITEEAVLPASRFAQELPSLG